MAVSLGPTFSAVAKRRGIFAHRNSIFEIRFARSGSQTRLEKQNQKSPVAHHAFARRGSARLFTRRRPPANSRHDAAPAAQNPRHPTPALEAGGGLSPCACRRSPGEF